MNIDTQIMRMANISTSRLTRFPPYNSRGWLKLVQTGAVSLSYGGSTHKLLFVAVPTMTA